MKPIGYFVMESCEDYEQALSLKHHAKFPADGILDWRGKGAATMFPTREAARAAINRTEHFRLAFGLTDLPEKRYCCVAAVTKP